MISGKNLRYIRGVHWVNPEEFAELMGVPLETLRDWEEGKRLLGNDDLIRLAKAMRVSPKKLFERLSKGNDFYPYGDFSDVPRAPEELLLSVRGGTILDLTGLECEVLRFPTRILGMMPEATFLYRIKSANMAPKIPAGAFCVFEPPFGLEDFETVLVRIEGKLTVRDIHQRNCGDWQLVSWNDLYPPITLDVKGDQILEFCLGRYLCYAKFPSGINSPTLSKKLIGDRKRALAI